MLHVQRPAHGLLELLPELLPLESSSATHSHWPAQVGLLDDELTDDDGELGTLDALAHVTQPRMTQIMNLLHLTPDIQESLLFLPRVTSGKAAIHEKLLRPIAAEIDWGKQREMWEGLEPV